MKRTPYLTPVDPCRNRANKKTVPISFLTANPEEAQPVLCHNPSAAKTLTAKGSYGLPHPLQQQTFHGTPGRLATCEL